MDIEDCFNIDSFQMEEEYSQQQNQLHLQQQYQEKKTQLLNSSDIEYFLKHFYQFSPIDHVEVTKEFANCIQKYLNNFQKEMNILSQNSPDIKNILGLLLNNSKAKKKKTNGLGLKHIKLILNDEKYLSLRIQFLKYINGDAYNIINNNKKLNLHDQNYMEFVLFRIQQEIPKGKNAFKSFYSNTPPQFQDQIDIICKRLRLLVQVTQSQVQALKQARASYD